MWQRASQSKGQSRSMKYRVGSHICSQRAPTPLKKESMITSKYLTGVIWMKSSDGLGQVIDLSYSEVKIREDEGWS